MRYRKLALAVVLGTAAIVSACGGDNPAAVLDVDASIDGVPIAESGPRNPQRLYPDAESELSMTITNTSDEAVEVGRFRLEGEMLGLTFLSYDTRVALSIEPGETRALTVPLDFFDLETQAHGYLRSWVRLYENDGDRTRLSSNEFVLDVRGDTTSTMSIFALVLLLVTGASVLQNLMALRRGTLPANRFRRGLRFAVSGLGVGLLLTVAFSVLRVFPLPTSGWVPLLIIPTAIGFALGYLSPGFVDDDIEEDDDEALDFAERVPAPGDTSRHGRRRPSG